MKTIEPIWWRLMAHAEELDDKPVMQGLLNGVIDSYLLWIFADPQPEVFHTSSAGLYFGERRG